MLKTVLTSGAAVLLLIGCAIWVATALWQDARGAHWFTTADLHIVGTVLIASGLLVLWKALRSP